MKEHGIIFSGDMVRAILDGCKTQTRRVIKPQPNYIDGDGEPRKIESDLVLRNKPIKCPYGVPGDRLWVRETWRIGAWDIDDNKIGIDYRADNYARQEWLLCEDEDLFERLITQSSDDAERAGLKCGEDDGYHWQSGESPCRWRSPRFMPRWASRILLTIKNVRVERVQDIRGDDLYAEGISMNGALAEFIGLWNNLNAKRGYGWDKNPWVWVIEFEKAR